MQVTWKVICLGAFIAMVSGCGGESGVGAGKAKTVPLTGKVTLDGSSHGGVNLQFIPKSADAGVRTAYSQVSADGTFAATTYVTGDGIVPGKYTVQIGASEDVGSADPAKMMAAVNIAAVETVEIDVPADGLTDIELKFKSKPGSKGAGGGAMLGM